MLFFICLLHEFRLKRCENMIINYLYTHSGSFREAKGWTFISQSVSRECLTEPSCEYRVEKFHPFLEAHAFQNIISYTIRVDLKGALIESRDAFILGLNVRQNTHMTVERNVGAYLPLLEIFLPSIV